ncbi:SCO-spondin-like isoform X3 [Styela clava]
MKYLFCLCGVILAFWITENSVAQKARPIKWGAPWGNWSKCSVTCGGGTKERSKYCTTPGVLESRCVRTRRRPCNIKKCPDIVPPPTADLPVLTETTGPPKPMPEYIAIPEPTGTPMPMPESTDTPIPWPEGVDGSDVDYTLAPWGDWSDCSVVCGGGVKYRTRECEKPNGRPECEGADAEECNIMPCDDGSVGEPIPIMPTVDPETWPEGDGKLDIKDEGADPEGQVKIRGDYDMASWGPWSTCSMICGSGVRYRTRECEKPNGRPECEETDADVCNTNPCDDGAPVGEPLPTYSSLEDIDEIPEGETILIENLPWPEGEQPAKDGATVDGTLPIDTSLKDKGADPEGETVVIGELPWPEGETPVKDMDYDMALWGPWSVCDMKCGGGMRYRARECKNPNGRPECEEAGEEACNTDPCDDGLPVGEPLPTDYSLKDKDADPEGQIKITGVVPWPEGEPPMKDKELPWPEGETPVKDMDYDMALWGPWSVCDMKCGGGMRYRTRECKNPNGRPECEEAGEEACNTDPCDDGLPVGEPLPTDYSLKDKDVDPEGQIKITGVVPWPEGEPPMKDKELPWPEGETPVKDMDYDMALWGPWSVCDMKCGGGMRYRTRECKNPNGRPECEEAGEEKCNTDPCDDALPVGEPLPTDYSLKDKDADPEGQIKITGVVPWPEGEPPMKDKVKYKEWGDWEECSASCGGGMRFRVRECLKENGQKECEDSQSEMCNEMDCPEDPEPSSYVVTTPTKSTPASTTSKSYEMGKYARKKICGNDQLRASGNIVRTAVSPSYPASYPSGLDCMWTISAKPGRRVRITVKNFNISEGDKLTLLEGRPRQIPYSKAKIATLTGEVKSGTEYRSLSRFLTVRLQTAKDSKGGKYTIAYSSTSSRLEENDKIVNPAGSPRVELWYRMLRTFAKWFMRMSNGYNA